LLEKFVQHLPSAYRFAFEFRHASWFSDPVFSILKSRNVALCWAESEKITTPRVPTADFLYYRFRLPEFSDAQLETIANELREQIQKREAFAFFKHEEQPESALNAVKVARRNGIEPKPFVLPEKKKGGAKKVAANTGE
jgi:uncharacterized protein YecE (DUF72 family)